MNRMKLPGAFVMPDDPISSFLTNTQATAMQQQQYPQTPIKQVSEVPASNPSINDLAPVALDLLDKGGYMVFLALICLLVWLVKQK